jgi:hypothetical protein
VSAEISRARVLENLGRLRLGRIVDQLDALLSDAVVYENTLPSAASSKRGLPRMCLGQVRATASTRTASIRGEKPSSGRSLLSRDLFDEVFERTTASPGIPRLLHTDCG